MRGAGARRAGAGRAGAGRAEEQEGSSSRCAHGGRLGADQLYARSMRMDVSLKGQGLCVCLSAGACGQLVIETSGAGGCSKEATKVSWGCGF